MFNTDEINWAEVLFGGILGLVLVVLVKLLLGAVGIDFYESLSSSESSLMYDYPCAQTNGCDTRALNSRTLTNDELYTLRQTGQPISSTVASSLFTNWVPGQDRSLVPQLVNSANARRNIGGGDNWDVMMQQVGNTGTVLNPAINGLMNPAPVKMVTPLKSVVADGVLSTHNSTPGPYKAL